MENLKLMLYFIDKCWLSDDTFINPSLISG